MRVIILLAAVFIGSQNVNAKVDRPQGWQFHNFFGSYTVSSSGGSCSDLSGSVVIGLKDNGEYPFIEIHSKFSTDGGYFTYLRNSNTKGGDCYECDSGAWETEVVSGDGVNHAIFKREGVTPYNHNKYSTTVEIVKLGGNRFYLKWNDCFAEIRK